MKVAIAFPGCHRRGGVERVMLECTNYLAANGHETHAFAIDWDPDADAIDHRVIRHTAAATSRGYIPRLAGFIRESRRDMASLSPPADVLAGFGIESPLDSVVWMQSVHRAWLEISAHQRSFQGRLKQRLNPAHAVILALEKRRFTHPQYKKVVALSSVVKDDIIRFYGVPESDIVVIPNGYSPSEFTVDRREHDRKRVRAELCFSNSDKVIVFVANELERKGFYPLLAAVSSLKDPSLHILAVGRLNHNAYRAETERFGMEGRVHWTGPSSSVAQYYAAADLFVLPTQYEAWGLVIVEALACGLPVVTSRLAGAAIAVRERENGLLLENPNDPKEIADAVRKMLSTQRLDAYAISASVSDFAWGKVLRKYEEVLEAACA